MKKALSLFLAAIMILSLAACGTQETTSPQPMQNSEQTDTSSPAESTAPAEPADGTASEETSAPEEKSSDPETSGSEETGRKILIVYLTPANSDTADAISSATPRVGDVASVEYVAQLISEQIDADIAKIIPETAYPLPYGDAADQAKQEQNDDARPAFTLEVNPEDYDVIFFGYPIWWYHLPMIARNFFETYDLSGKTIIPYVLHAGSRDGGTFNEIRELEPNAIVPDGLAVAGERADRAQDDVNEWLAGLSY